MYKYGMRLRGFSLGCQPKHGFYKREDDTTGKYWDILIYTRKLTESEMLDYELDYIGEMPETTDDFADMYTELGAWETLEEEHKIRKEKTWGDLLKQFSTEYPALYSKMDDYRPFAPLYLPTDRAGIIVYMKNGDALVYIPKE